MNNNIYIFVRDNLYLRFLKEKDATNTYCSWLNDTEVNKYLTTKKVDLQGLRDYIYEKNSSTDSILLGIFTGDIHIGNVKLDVVLDERRAVLGILIGDKKCHNRGIGTDVIKSVCEYAFNKIGLTSIEAGVLKRNVSSIKAFLKAGFSIVESGFDPAFKQTDNVVMRIEEYPKVCAIIQARMGSTRLPGKALLPIGDRTSIGHVINRVQKATTVDKVVLATGKNTINNPLAEEAYKYGIEVFRGSDDWLLDRYYECAEYYDVDTIIRITGDCVLVDPVLIDEVVTLFNTSGADYASNVHPPTYPDGFDIEVFSRDALRKSWDQANLDSDREHSTPYFWKKKGLFKHASLENDVDLNEMRVVLDYDRDLDILRDLEKIIDFETADCKSIVDAYNSLDIEKYAERNEGYAESLQNDTTSYDKSLSKSEELIKKAQKIIPCAAQTYSKSYRHFAYPIFLDRGLGSHVWDVDGNEYVDFNCGLGAISLGYDYGDFNDRCSLYMQNGVSFSQPNPIEVELADKIIDIIPSAERVKFMKNGSDVTTAAIRLARAYTGRDVVAKCGYHGFHDWSIGVTTNNLGVPDAVSKLTMEFGYNDIESLTKIFDEHSVAAVIMEPFQFDGPVDRFLSQVRDLCDKYNTILIFDEVLSGFRTVFGGFEEYDYVYPDLSTFGKAVANGFPLSILAGQRDIMELISGRAFISTTFGGDVLSMAAALYTIEEMEKTHACDKMKQLGTIWKREAELLLKKYKIPGIGLIGHPTHCGLTFESTEVLSFYQQAMAERGILTLGINNLCLSHTERDIMNFVRALDEVLGIIKESSSLPFCREYRVQPVFVR